MDSDKILLLDAGRSVRKITSPKHTVFWYKNELP